MLARHVTNSIIPGEGGQEQRPLLLNSQASGVRGSPSSSSEGTMAARTLALLLALQGLAVGATAHSNSSPPADRIFHNASFLISVSRTGSHTAAAALAVRDGRVVYHGDLETALHLYGGPSTELVDMGAGTSGGSFIVPGFIDSHVHWLDGGMQLAMLSLREARSLEEFREAVRLAAAHAKEGEWILGMGWNENKWEQHPHECRGPAPAGGDAVPGSAQGDLQGRRHEGLEEARTCAPPRSENKESQEGAACSASPVPTPRPHRSWIDDITPSNPVLLMRVDGHVALANSAALAAAGLTGAEADPERGEVVRDADGAITGLLREGAIGLVSRHVPPPSSAQRLEGLKRAQDEALRLGVTSVIDFGRYYPGSSEGASWEDLIEVYLPADEARELRVRVHCVLPLTTRARLREWIRGRGRQASPFLRWGLLKAFADGSVGSRTALFHEPYADANTTGLLLLGSLALTEFVRDVMENSGGKMGVAVHAIGDAAVDFVLQSFSAARSSQGDADPESDTESSSGAEGAEAGEQAWLRVEHAQHVTEAAVARFRQLGVIPSMQPYHLVDDVHVLTPALGEERATGTSYRFRSLHASSPGLALGSDWPVVTMDPMAAMLGAGHKTESLQSAGFVTEDEGLDALQALYGYTLGAANGGRFEDVGSLEEGRFADMVELDGDLIAALREGKTPEILRVYVAGTVQYDSSKKIS